MLRMNTNCGVNLRFDIHWLFLIYTNLLLEIRRKVPSLESECKQHHSTKSPKTS